MNHTQYPVFSLDQEQYIHWRPNHELVIFKVENEIMEENDFRYNG